MSIITKLAAGAAVVVAAGLMPAIADGYDKKKAHYAAPVAAGCDASKFAGFYAGIHGGMGSLTSTLTDRDNWVDRASVQHVEDGILVGGQIGYNWVKCSGLFGIEADFSFGNIDSTTTYNGAAGGPGTESVKHSMDWLATIRTRSGIAIGDVMIYATGGLAFANIDTTYELIGNPDAAFTSGGTRTGWVAGLGTEYAMTDRVRITGDILYYDFGTESSTIRTGATDFRFDDHHSLWVSRIGLSFKLGHHEAYHEPLK